MSDFALKNRYDVRMSVAEDARLLAEHLARANADNGDDGLYYAPFPADDGRAAVTDERVAQLADELRIPMGQPGCRARWVAVERSSGAIVGVAGLKGGRIASEMHRVTLGMGIEPGHRGMGLGEWLLREAIAWAKSEATLAWIDLGVFEGNDRAMRLYHRLGFVEIGRRKDAFRVSGTSITDIEMVLAL